MNECSGAVHGTISVKTRRRLFDPAPMPMWIVILAVVGICVLVLPLVGMVMKCLGLGFRQSWPHRRLRMRCG